MYVQVPRCFIIVNTLLMNSFKKIALLFCIGIISSLSVYGQNLQIVKNKVDAKFLENIESPDFTGLFTKMPAAGFTQSDEVGGTVLQLNQNLLSLIVEEQNEVLSLDIPFGNELLSVKLIKTDLGDVNVRLISEGENSGRVSSRGVFYHGYIDGEENSIGSMSFTKNNVYGMFASEIHSNLSFTKLENNTYLFYPDKDFDRSNYTYCSTEDEDLPQGAPEEINETSANNDNCVQMEWVVSYRLYQRVGSNIEEVEDFILGLFNNVQVMYENEDISTKLKELVIYDEADPFDHSNSGEALTTFRDLYPHNQAGVLYHLLDLSGNNNGGRAYLSVLCNSAYNIAYSDIRNSYKQVPDYSWSVKVITHEIGHNLGSRHTHWCGWPGGSIDGCGPTYHSDYTEGDCEIGPLPSGGGTIMSYCHLLGSVGVNFTKGFGPLPGDFIRERVNSAYCLVPCCALDIEVDVQVTHASCGENNGSITVSATGGGSYTHEWSANANTGDTATAVNLYSDAYTLVLTFEDGCVITRSINVGGSRGISSTAQVTHTTCGEENGRIAITATGGSDYKYEWSGKASYTNGPIASNLPPGTYSVTVTSWNGCTSVNTETIEESYPLTATTSVQDESCYEECDGSIDVVAEGGTEPYFYLWSVGGAGYSNVQDLCPGEYVVTVTDFDNCITVESISIKAAEELQASLSVAGNNIEVSVSGGTEPYTYAWNTGQTTATIEIDSDIKFYQVTITDANGCEIALEHTISSTVDANRFPGKIFPNPAADVAYIEAPEDLNSYELTLYDFSGVQLFKTSVHNQKTYSLNLKDFNPGAMIVKIESNRETYYAKIVKH